MTENMFIVVGVLVWLFGIVNIVWHIRQRRACFAAPQQAQDEVRFQEQRYRRRMQTSSLTITLGALISLCDYLTWTRASAGFFTIYVLGLLLLTMWLILLALGDAMASRIHLTQSLRRNRNSRLALQQAIDELRDQQARELHRSDRF